MSLTVKDVAKAAGIVLSPGAYAGYKLAKENPEKAKEFAKCAIIPGYCVYKAGQKAINFFKN